MRVLMIVMMLAMATLSFMAQTSSSTTSGDVYPFTLWGPNYIYLSAYQRLRDIDFRNFSIHLPQESKDVFLANGHYQHGVEVGAEAVDLNEVHYLNVPNSTGSEYVLLLLQEKTGEKQQAIAQVLEFANQRLRLVQQFEKDTSNGSSHFAYRFSESSQILQLQAANSAIAYQWSGRDFTHLASK